MLFLYGNTRALTFNFRFKNRPVTVKKCLQIEIQLLKYMQIITCPKGYQLQQI